MRAESTLSCIKLVAASRLAHPAPVITLAISDVPGDDPAVIGSGPTVPDPTTLADARAIIGKYRLDLPEAVTRALNDPGNESPKPGDRIFTDTSYRIIARPADALAAAQARVREAGYDCVVLGDRLQGEAREVAATHARLARDLAAAHRRMAILSGGELTVTLKGGGHGGPNQEYALALAIHLAGAKAIAALAADTDGTDGGRGRPDDPAGAFIDDTTGGCGPKPRRLSIPPPPFSPTTIPSGFCQRHRRFIHARPDVHQRYRLRKKKSLTDQRFDTEAGPGMRI